MVPQILSDGQKLQGLDVCSYSFKYNQQDTTLYNILYYCQCSTCFRQFLHPSSGAQNCTHSIWYISSLLAATASVGELEQTRPKIWPDTWMMHHNNASLHDTLAFGHKTDNDIRKSITFISTGPMWFLAIPRTEDWFEQLWIFRHCQHS
jgi:hypothetical protein